MRLAFFVMLLCLGGCFAFQPTDEQHDYPRQNPASFYEGGNPQRASKITSIAAAWRSYRASILFLVEVASAEGWKYEADQMSRLLSRIENDSRLLNDPRSWDAHRPLAHFRNLSRQHIYGSVFHNALDYRARALQLLYTRPR